MSGKSLHLLLTNNVNFPLILKKNAGIKQDSQISIFFSSKFLKNRSQNLTYYYYAFSTKPIINSCGAKCRREILKDFSGRMSQVSALKVSCKR